MKNQKVEIIKKLSQGDSLQSFSSKDERSYCDFKMEDFIQVLKSYKHIWGYRLCSLNVQRSFESLIVLLIFAFVMMYIDCNR